MSERTQDPAIRVRVAQAGDTEAILEIGRELVRDGTTYVFAPDTPDEELRAYWLAAGTTFVADRAGQVVGCYVLRPNQPGRGRHVANASYAVASGGRGHGVGRAMGAHSIAEARRQGYRAMQFNVVVSTNLPALRLWRELGFREVGRVPEAFQHPDGRLVDTVILHRCL